MMKNVMFVVTLAACGSKSSTPVANAGSGNEPAGPTDSRTALEKRRDGACETLAPRITACAVEDAKRDLAAGKVTQKDFDLNTAPEFQRKNTQKYIDECQGKPFSSRQVRVLEVCQREESECEPLLACLDNLKPKQE